MGSQPDRLALLLLIALVLSSCATGRPRQPSPAPATGATPTTSASASAPSAAPSDVRYGASFAGSAYRQETARALELAGRAGLGSIRLSCGWSRVEPSPGAFVWTICDQIVDGARAAGLDVLFMLQTATPTNTTAPDSVTDLAQREAYPPADFAAFERYVEESVRHYAGRVTYWEIGNEPDLRFYWRATAAEYARVLAAAHRAAKRADPKAMIVFGGLSLGGTAGNIDPTFFEKVLDDRDNPGRTSFDVASYHHYGPPAEAKKRHEYISRELRERGLRKPIWVTEVGASGSDEAAQARYLEGMLPYLLSLGAERVFWFQMYDDPRGGATFASYGLLRADLTPRPAYDAYARLIRSR